jgi:Amt family ammonium transporter
MSKLSLKNLLPFLILAIISIVAIFYPTAANFDGSKVYNSGDMAWVLVATSLVFLMTPGLSFFYGGMVSRKNVLSTMIQSFIATGIISLLWVVVGFSLAFGKSVNGIIGDPSTFAFFKGVNSSAPWSLGPTIPLLLFALFQLKFAIITPALVVGALAERIKFSSYLIFIILFSLVIYAPIAHWTWHPDGILFKMGVLDFAGGTVVHISAGCAALAGAIVLKRRKAHREKTEVMLPTFLMLYWVPVCCGSVGSVSMPDLHWLQTTLLLPLSQQQILLQPLLVCHGFSLTHSAVRNHPYWDSALAR